MGQLLKSKKSTSNQNNRFLILLRLQRPWCMVLVGKGGTLIAVLEIKENISSIQIL